MPSRVRTATALLASATLFSGSASAPERTVEQKLKVFDRKARPRAGNLQPKGFRSIPEVEPTPPPPDLRSSAERPGVERATALLTGARGAAFTPQLDRQRRPLAGNCRAHGAVGADDEV